MVDTAYETAEKILRKNRKTLDKVVERLMKVETLEQDEFEKIIIAHGIIPKKKMDIEHQA